MSNKNDGDQNAKVLKLGFNISVSGDPGTDFEIVLDDNNQNAIQSSSQYEEQLQRLDTLEGSTTDGPKHELEKSNILEAASPHSRGAISKQTKTMYDLDSDSLKMNKFEKEENSTLKDISIISKIESTMEHFEKFSDHIKEIPRFKNFPIATSTPFPDKYNSKSEPNLMYPQYRSRKCSRFYDIYSKKDYYKSSAKPDLFLKPLPGEGYYKRGIYSRYLDLEPYKQYGSDDSLNKTSDKIIYGKSNYDFEKYEGCSVIPDPPSGILKKSDSESGDRHSTSSADSIKDVKIYQTGGILIMQNFKESLGLNEKREISEFSAKLIENCNKLKLEMNNLQEDKPAIGNSSDENKNSGKIVQFDLSSLESQKSKSGDSSLNALKDESSCKLESSESANSYMKKKDTSPQGASQSQDFLSLSTQENDSILSNQPGMSPSYASSKKLEWDSGADVGYLNLDLTKENLSTIEKIVLKGLSSDGLSEKNVVYEKKPEPDQVDLSKFIMERKPSDPVVDVSKNSRDEIHSKKKSFTPEETKKREEDPLSISDKEMERDDTKSDLYKNSLKINSTAKTSDFHSKELTDKSVNVNTLFEDNSCQTPISISKEYFNPLEYHKPKIKKSPKLSIPKSKRPSSYRISKSTKKSTSDGFEMGVPKKIYKKVEAAPALNDVELNRKVEEIIIDQRFKIKQNVAVEKEIAKESEIPIKDKINKVKEIKNKSRPISASSSSNNTVLPKSESRELLDEKPEKFLGHFKLIDQIIQTSDHDCESIGIQAFASQISSDGDIKSLKKGETIQPMTKGFKENVNISSKNIQAFGLNSSLPKQLEHPKETALYDNQQTKSTQFFGGPLNSLPNYHTNLASKFGESCGRALNILKAKKNSEAEIIRLREENKKNILANDTPILANPKNDTKKRCSNGNKENLISKSLKGQNSGKNSRSNVSREFEEKESEQSHTSEKKKSPSFEGSEPHTSDEVSSTVLTYEVLKVHGESIDRNIIQEKYFQSQQVEFEKRKMISRSTSMEMQLQILPDEAIKELITTGCQYSPQSRGSSNGEQDLESSKAENSNRKYRKKVSERRLSQNTVEENFITSKTQEQSLEAGDSLPSSSQTAHSWIPKMQDSHKNASGVDRARSFEYLPGHIYESSGNLREQLQSETERNLITSSSSDSNTAKGSVSDGGARDSEGRSTLILENSSQNSRDSDRLKILDETLAQLNVVVLKLSEKDAQMQSVTQSLLANLWKKNGSGDYLVIGEGDTSKTEGRDSPYNENQPVEALSEAKEVAFEQNIREERACQSEGKSSPEPEKYYEEKEALEKRISKEKLSQIKWIENEIQHLNVLRELLEKQSSSASKKKKLSPHTITSSDDAKSKENYQRNIAEEICSRTVTPVYGCTISLSGNPPSEKNHTEEDCRPKEKEPCSPQYKMAVSVTSDCSKNWKHIVMVPVGLQVSLNNPDLSKKGYDEEKHSSLHRQGVPDSVESNMIVQPKPFQTDVNTQFPSSTNIYENPSASVQTNFPSTERLNHCGKENCFCINLSGKSSLSVSRSSKSKSSEKRDSPKLRFSNAESGTISENKTSNTTDPELAQMDSCSASHLDKKIAKTSGDESFDLTGSLEKWRSSHSTNFKCKKASEKSEHSQCVSTQSTVCKCQHQPERVSSSVHKEASVCKGSCKSNIYLSSEKSSSDSRTCRCSKIQVQKSLHGNCHIIKIHGSKCCTQGKSLCSCGKRSVVKKTENQCCQTDSDQIKSTLEIKNTEAQPIGKDSPLLEESPCDSKVTEEKSAIELSLKEKHVLKDRMEEMNGPRKVKTSLDCTCRRKSEKEDLNDHPRHYFLKIEETEVDDSFEPKEEKKSLEVITVKVPVKKAGRSKIYDNNIQQSRESENFKPHIDVSSIKCKCCSDCADNCRVPDQDYNPSASSSYQKNLAEKPESPTWNSRSRPPESICEDVGFYLPKELPQRFRTFQGYYQDKNGSSHERTADDYDAQCCESCKCVNRNVTSFRKIQNEYDNHKTRKTSNANGSRRLYEDRRKQDDRACFDLDQRLEDSSFEPRRFRTQKLPEKVSCLDPDYYNYNKREFMTKSELIKEDSQKRKIQQPSLQECLSSNRPDFYSSAERRREIINKRAADRIQKHNNRMECLLKMLQKCNEDPPSTEPKKIFTTSEMREQTMKRYKKLPEVTGKIADQKKKEEYRTNRLMADIFAKKLQIEALKEITVQRLFIEALPNPLF